MPSSSIDKFRADFLDLLAPAHCHWCGRATDGVPACPGCVDSLPWNDSCCRACALPLPAAHEGASRVCAECLADSPPQDRSWAAFRYDAPVAQEILALKFHGQLAPAHVLGCVMAHRLAQRPEPLPELLIPVPLHPARLRRRGYNQAGELARALAAMLDVTVAPTAARRIRATGEQSRLDARSRRHNVRGAFEVGRVVCERHIALLDDVVTTGATVAELAWAARRAGAATIEVWAAARVA